MKRRVLLATTARLCLGGAAYFSLPGAWAQPNYTVSMTQLQDAVAKRFPVRKRASGLLDLTVQAPQLRLLPEQNRLGATMAVEAAGPHCSAPTPAPLTWTLRCATRRAT